MSTSIQTITAELFRTLSHPLRVRLLQELRGGERSVTELQSTVDLDSSRASQHLAMLHSRGLLERRKERTSVFYSVKDQRIFQMLEVAHQILTAQYEERQELLADLGDGAGR